MNKTLYVFCIIKEIVKMIKIIKIKKYIINLMKNIFPLAESTNRIINSQEVKKINNIKSIEEIILNNLIIASYIVFFKVLNTSKFLFLSKKYI